MDDVLRPQSLRVAFRGDQSPASQGSAIQAPSLPEPPDVSLAARSLILEEGIGALSQAILRADACLRLRDDIDGYRFWRAVVALIKASERRSEKRKPRSAALDT